MYTVYIMIMVCQNIEFIFNGKDPKLSRSNLGMQNKGMFGIIIYSYPLFGQYFPGLDDTYAY